MSCAIFYRVVTMSPEDFKANITFVQIVKKYTYIQGIVVTHQKWISNPPMDHG